MLNNVVNIIGIIDSEPEFNHTFYEDDYYIIYVKIKRLSNNIDRLPVIINSKNIDISLLTIGKVISIKGNYRSFNHHDEISTHLFLSVFANSIELLENPEKNNVNEIFLNGYICKKPVFRKTPLNRTVCDVLLAVNRKTKKSDYIPCILWGKYAEACKDLDTGANLQINGRIQSRVYQKKTDEETYVEKIAYEVSANKVNIVSNSKSQESEQIKKTE